MQKQKYSFHDEEMSTIYSAVACPENPTQVLKTDCNIDINDAVAGIDGSCTYLGRRSEVPSYQFIDSSNPKLGIKVTYGQGSSCLDIPKAKLQTTFAFFCEKSGSALPEGEIQRVKSGIQSELVSPCQYQFDFLVPGACPVYVGKGGVPLSIWLPFLIVTVIALYCAVGVYLKKRMYGSSGVEIVPHIDLIRKLKARCFGHKYPKRYYQGAVYEQRDQENSGQRSNLLQDDNLDPTEISG